jgi:hypothetical protein
MYNIDPQVIKRRLKGIGPRLARKGPSRVLNDAQEKVLIEYLIFHDDLGAHPSPTLVRNAANTILLNAHSSATKTPREVSKMFAYQFIKCQKDFFKAR